MVGRSCAIRPSILAGLKAGSAIAAPPDHMTIIGAMWQPVEVKNGNACSNLSSLRMPSAVANIAPVAMAVA